jgi:hypothetical protein
MAGGVRRGLADYGAAHLGLEGRTEERKLMEWQARSGAASSGEAEERPEQESLGGLGLGMERQAWLG